MTADLVRILVLCLLSAVLVLTLRKNAPEQAFLCALAAGAAVLILIARTVSAVTGVFSALLTADAGEYFKIALKSLGIAYLTGFVADTCRDFGQAAMASFAELGGRCAILILCLPMLSSLLRLALQWTKL